MSDYGFRRFFLVIVLLWAVGSPAFARHEGRGTRGEGRENHLSSLVPRPSPLAPHQAVVLADSWGIGSFLSGGGRARIVQICVVAMCIALFIMMKKLNG